MLVFWKTLYTHLMDDLLVRFLLGLRDDFRENRSYLILDMKFGDNP